ncbi:YbgF trimerization domain-containing protein [bacterium endosymbiont of Pedicinus badii]|uniref:YbgF trimerization domain-containing protein n=1 Tax=bacterium endosymbiont of Pedicinus badii TaxID=1719126 RepID=UPI0009BC035C|nr:YbgF trimerization domain-containing protein [bacterium endosymbiont of Pedicinus badii]OQM34327.1 hypothetical protein AOQ89_00310 [bacterium endosymbiont of Pedicinus badii]
MKKIIFYTFLIFSYFTTFKSTSANKIKNEIEQMKEIKNAHEILIFQLQNKIDFLQKELDSLRGLVEKNEYDIEKILQNQKKTSSQKDNSKN